MRISWSRVATALLVFVVVVPLAVFAWLSVTKEETPDRVRVSVDGVRWSADIEDALFYSETPWEPGEARSAILVVRNDAPVPADVTVSVICQDGQELIEQGALVVSAAVGDGSPQPFDSGRDDNDVRLMTLGSGESTPLTLQAELVSDIPDAKTIDSMDVEYRVVGSGRPVEESGASVTKSRLVLAPVFLGLALIVTAVIIVSTGRSGLNRSRRRPS